jgi:hypothetical protein
MATQEEILVMIRKADSAGNVEDAKRLTQLYDEAGQAQTLEINNLAEGVRTVAKGATFGFADEIEAKVRTGQSVKDQVSTSMSYKDAYKALKQLPIAGRTDEQKAQAQQLTSILKGEKQQKADVQDAKYKGVRDDLRASNAEFARQNPKTAMALEVAGGIATPIAGLSALRGASLGAKVAGGALQGGGFGALYGAGNAKEMKDVAGDAMAQGALGALTGGALSGAGAILAPKVSAGVKKMMEKNDLTYGQMGGKTASTFEQKLGSVVTGVKSRRHDAMQNWNREVAEEVAGTIGAKIPSNLKTNSEYSQFITKAVNEAYDSAFDGMQVKLTPKLKTQFADLLENSGLERVAKKKLKSELSKIQSMARKNPVGRSVKNVDSNIKKRVDAFRKSTNLNESPLEDPLRKARELFKESVIEQNPKQGAKWLATDKAYGQIASFQKAVGLGNKNEVFSPSQLNRSATEGMSSASKRISKANQTGRLQKISNEAEDVLGDFVPDSGTAGNMALNAGVTGLINPTALLAYGIGELAYNPSVIKFANNYIRNSGSRAGLREAIQKYAGTATSGLLTLQD